MATRVTRGASVAVRYSFDPFRCTTAQSRRNLVTLLVSLWNDLDDLVNDLDCA